MAVCTGGGRSGFGVFVIPMTEELGWNRSTISLAAALGALISGLSQPFVGVSIVDGNLSCQHGSHEQIQNSDTYGPRGAQSRTYFKIKKAMVRETLPHSIRYMSVDKVSTTSRGRRALFRPRQRRISGHVETCGPIA